MKDFISDKLSQICIIASIKCTYRLSNMGNKLYRKIPTPTQNNNNNNNNTVHFYVSTTILRKSFNKLITTKWVLIPPISSIKYIGLALNISYISTNYAAFINEQ